MSAAPVRPVPVRPVPARPAKPAYQGTCPICRKPAEAAFRPFCSARCADVDLAHWLRGDYRIPAEPVDPEAQDPSAQ